MLDNLRRKLDHDDAMLGMDSFNQRAFEVLSSRRVFEALDLSKEDPRLRARYGIGDMPTRTMALRAAWTTSSWPVVWSRPARAS